MGDGGERKRSKVRTVALGERFVLVTIDDTDEPAGSLKNAAFQGNATSLRADPKTS